MRIEGRNIRLIRLDPEGRPLDAEPITLKAASIEPEFLETENAVIEEFPPVLKRLTVEVRFKDVKPEVMALLYGHRFKPRPWWWRFLPRRIKTRLKKKEIRRAYGANRK